MKKKIIFSVFFLILILLFAYKAIFWVNPLIEDQKMALDGTLNMSISEMEHMEDVNSVLFGFDVLMYLSLLVVTGMLTFYKDISYLRYGGITVMAVVVMLGVLSLFSFDTVFSWFHLVFFPQGNWQFAADSVLITTFPLEFFVEMSKRIFLFAFVLGGASVGISLKKW